MTCVQISLFQDSLGQSALHVSISCKEPQCSDILLSHSDLDLTIKDKAGNTPFAKAMAVRDDETGRAILKREPKAAEQVIKASLLCPVTKSNKIEQLSLELCQIQFLSITPFKAFPPKFVSKLLGGGEED